MNILTSYDNAGGKGNRLSYITATSNPVRLFHYGNASYLVNGSFYTDLYFSSQSIANKYLQFEFQKEVLINEIKWRQSNGTAHGIWQVQGSNDTLSWENIGTAFTLGGSNDQTITAIQFNMKYYKYYRLLGISGNCSSSPYLYEIEFKIAEKPKIKYLIKTEDQNHNNRIQILNSSNLWEDKTSLIANPLNLTQSDYETHGMDALTVINSTALENLKSQGITTFKVMTWEG